jgi:hypothetical protein
LAWSSIPTAIPAASKRRARIAERLRKATTKPPASSIATMGVSAEVAALGWNSAPCLAPFAANRCAKIPSG